MRKQWHIKDPEGGGVVVESKWDRAALATSGRWDEKDLVQRSGFFPWPSFTPLPLLCRALGGGRWLH